MHGAQVIGSVVGPGVVVNRGAKVVASILYPGSVASQELMQLSVLGRDANAFPTSGFYDVNFERNVRVQVDGRLVDSGSRGLGVCVGHGARVGPTCHLGSGREVPNGTLIVERPEDVARRIEPLAKGEIGVVRDGAVVPLRKR